MNALAIVPVAGGKWVIGGVFTHVNNVPCNFIARLNSDGSTDTSFETGDGFDTEVVSLAVQGDGMIVAGGGFTTYDGVPVGRIVRLRTDGALDPLFTTRNGSGFNGDVHSLALQADGRIVVSGVFDSFDGLSRRCIARLTMDGRCDESFQPGSGLDSAASRLIVQPDGRILAGGYFSRFNGHDAKQLVRITPSGSYDGSPASVLGSSRLIFALALQPDGRILAGGSAQNGSSHPAILERFNADWTQDTTFSTGTVFDRAYAVSAIALQADGRIVVESNGGSYDGTRVSGIARVNPDGTWDRVFGAPIQGWVTGTPAALVLADDGTMMTGCARGFGGARVYGGLVAWQDGPPLMPVIEEQPAPVTATAGSTVTFTVQSTGMALRYQWYKDDVPMPGATTAVLTIANVTRTDLGQYYVVVGNDYGAVKSNVVPLLGALPVIHTPPQSAQIVCRGTATLTVAASGAASEEISYQWRKLGCPISGATGAALAIENVELADDAFYDVVVTNAVGSTTSAPARLRVNPTKYLTGGLKFEQVGPRFEAEGGMVNALCLDSSGRIYVGGDFAAVNGASRRVLARLNADGSLDATFVPADIEGWAIKAMVLQPDGKLVVGGAFTRIAGVSRRFVARFNQDGSLDPAFAVGGGFDQPVTALVLQSDGKIVVGGEFTRYNAFSCGRIVRLNSDGSIDAGFNAGGGFDGRVVALAEQANGILVGGAFSHCDHVPRARIARLLPTGALDPTFDPGTGLDADVTVLRVQPVDQKILVGGGFSSFNGVNCDRIIRLGTDGTRDAGFTSSTGFDGAVSALALQDDGKLVVSGPTSLTSRVIRLLPSGATDVSFDGGERAYGSRINGLALLADGRVVICGEFGASPDSRNMLPLAWIDAHGSFDAGDITWRRRVSPSLLVPAEGGKWLVGGGYHFINGEPHGGLARLNADWSLDPTFDIGTGFDQVVMSLAVQGDGRLLVGGPYTTFNGSPATNLVRLETNGAMDASFTHAATLTSSVEGLALTSDGRIMVGSWSFFDGDQRRYLARLNSDGSLDPSVNPGPDFRIMDPSFAIQDDGKIIAAGFAYAPAQQSVVRLNQSGEIDPTFQVPPGHLDLTNSVAVTVDGRIVTAGWATSAWRFSPDGAFDESFQDHHDFGGVSAVMALQGDGKILLGGYYGTPDGNTLLGNLIRVNSDGTRDRTFGAPVAGAWQWMNDDMLSIRTLADGRLLVTGARALTDAGELCGLLRLVEAPPAITQQPLSQVVDAGATVSFSVEVESTLPLTYQWSKDGVPLVDGADVAGATSAMLTLSDTVPGNSGNYTVVVANGAGQQLISQPALLVVNRRAATVTIGGLFQRYNGTPRPVTVATTPAGLPVAVSYDGETEAPVYPGSYAVTATITDPNYVGSASAVLEITSAAVVRHAPTLNGGIEGSLQVLAAENITLNGSAYVSGDLLVCGSPEIKLNGHPTLGGTREGEGASTPTSYRVTLNGSSLVRYVVRRIDPIALPAVELPPLPSGTRDVTINRAGQSAGDFATLRNLTLNGSAGACAVPPGSYGRFTANGSSRFVLGVAGATQPAVYNLQGLLLNGASELRIVSPVILTVKGEVILNQSAGAPEHPEWLQLRVANGGVTLNGNAVLSADVVAPTGTVILNGGCTLAGSVVSDRLTINGQAVLREVTP